MPDQSKDELHGRDTTPDDREPDSVTAQPGSGENAGVEPHTAQANTNTNKELEIKPSKNSSTVSLEQRSTHDVENGIPADDQAEKEPAVTDAEHDPNIVDWDGDADPENPLNWTARKKWLNIGVLSALTLLTPLGSSFFAPGVPRVMQDFNSSSEITATFVVSVYLLGFAFGPILIAPLSELYGRLYIYHACNLGYLVFTIACAVATNMEMLIVFRFFAGCWGVAPVTIGGGTVADLMRPEERGLAMSLWAMGALFGPILGPVCGGFLSAAYGWRWIFWVLAIAIAVVSLTALFTINETYAPVLLARKTARLRKESSNAALRSKLEQNLTPKEVFVRAITRPTKLMLFSPICALMSLYMAVVYGILYLLFTTFTFVFQEAYGFSESTVGLTYIGLGIGNFMGLAALGYSSDRILKRLTEKNGGKGKPEYRLPPLILGAPFIPAGLFVYGWTAQNASSVHWAVPLFGTLLVGIGMIAAFMAVNTYLIDAFTMYAASAMAANTILRSILGGVFPLFGLQMYDALGLYVSRNLSILFSAMSACSFDSMQFRVGATVS
ncbi:hypothetical protein MBLNU13_g04698t1 [Cladosporium sp. NU13]